jgi:hypothetical protein
MARTKQTPPVIPHRCVCEDVANHRVEVCVPCAEWKLSIDEHLIAPAMDSRVLVDARGRPVIPRAEFKKLFLSGKHLAKQTKADYLVEMIDMARMLHVVSPTDTSRDEFQAKDLTIERMCT